MPLILKVPILLPPWAIAQTWGPLILWKRSRPITPDVLAHELRHVDQAKRLLWIGWPFAYLLAWIRAGFRYSRISYELDAQAAATRPYYLEWAHQLIRDRHLT